MKIADIAAATPVFCKLSGIATEAASGWTATTLKPYAEHVINAFGAHRVMWGSDWPVLELNGDYQGWFKTAQAIAQPNEAAIFGGNAARFYRI